MLGTLDRAALSALGKRFLPVPQMGFWGERPRQCDFRETAREPVLCLRELTLTRGQQCIAFPGKTIVIISKVLSLTPKRKKKKK